jgi:DNA-binding response OmpR family regulator
LNSIGILTLLIFIHSLLYLFGKQMLAFRARPPEAPIILLVEDLEPLRSWLKTNLESAGFLVLQAGNCEEALGIASARVESIDLLLTHMRLHGVWGPSLAFLLRAHQPRMAALYMSNNLAEMMEMPDARGFISSLLPRPFSRELLLRRVSVVLDAHI